MLKDRQTWTRNRALIPNDVNPIKNNETQQQKRNPRSFYGQIRVEDLDPLFMTNKNLGIRKTPQTVVETSFDKSRWTPREIPISSSSSSKNQRE
jgi:hypothetical protein